MFELAGISEVVMTNDPLDPDEAPLWEQGAATDAQFHAVLRLDRILNKWEQHWQILKAKGYDVSAEAARARPRPRCAGSWTDGAKRMKPVYMAVSLPDTFAYPGREPARAVPARSRAAGLPGAGHSRFR